MSQIDGFVSKEKKKTYRVGLGRDQLEHLASPMTKSESKYQWIQDKSETIEKRLESGLLLQPYFQICIFSFKSKFVMWSISELVGLVLKNWKSNFFLWRKNNI